MGAKTFKSSRPMIAELTGWHVHVDDDGFCLDEVNGSIDGRTPAVILSPNGNLRNRREVAELAARAPQLLEDLATERAAREAAELRATAAEQEAAELRDEARAATAQLAALKHNGDAFAKSVVPNVRHEIKLRLEAETKLEAASAQNARLREAAEPVWELAKAGESGLGGWADETAARLRQQLRDALDATAEATTAWLAKRDERVRQEGARAERQRIANGLAVMAEWLEGCVAASVESGFPPQDYLDGRANGLREAAEYVTADWGIRACTDEGGRQ
jgi:hypothetical protein